MFYRVSNFIIFFYVMHFVSAHVFHDFVENLSDEDYSSRWSRLARHPTIIFIAVRDCELQRAREEGSRLVLSGLHNAMRLPPFSISRSKMPRMYTFVNKCRRVIWLRYVFVSYCFCNCYNVYGMRARYTDGDGARNIKCKR